MKIMLLLAGLLALAGCPPLDAKAVEACGKMCAEKGVSSVDGTACYCNSK